MPAPTGFRYEERKDGSVVLFHHGTIAGTLRSGRAAAFLDAVETGEDPQELMARLTGNYRRGNERRAAQHPRNSGR